MLPGLSVLEIPRSLTVVEALGRFIDQPLVILLDSAARIRPRDARYSFLTADPIATLRVDQVACRQPLFDVLRHWQTLLPEVRGDGIPPFCGGIAGLMSYELGQAFERLPSPRLDDYQTPALLAGLFDWCLVWDHVAGTVRGFVLELSERSGGMDTTARSQRRANWILGRLGLSGDGAVSAQEPAESEPTGGGIVPAVRQPGEHLNELEHVPGVYSAFTRLQYLAAVNRVVEYILAGDIFQANLSQQLQARWQGSAFELYRRVRERNPAPFCALLQTREFSVVSASPERFLKVTAGRTVETRPIKGTRRRQRSPIADLYTSEELTTSEKDRAENVMIVDLLRNDLSRSCRPGSVRVTGLCEIEVFETVQHLVSTIVGELSPGKDVWDLCAGSFPGGSVTGAPKIRAMQIISELEPAVRGAYCGSIFYAGPGQDFDSSILIRTFTLKDGWLQFPVGGGIVADSRPDDEYQETMHKASGMLRVLTGGEG